MREASGQFVTVALLRPSDASTFELQRPIALAGFAEMFFELRDRKEIAHVPNVNKNERRSMRTSFPRGG